MDATQRNLAKPILVTGGRGTLGVVPDMAGPRVYGMDELVRSYLAAAHKARPIVQFPLPGNAAKAIRQGAVLAPDGAVGRVTWEEFLRERVATAA